MSVTRLRRCPVSGCRFNRHPILADSVQLKNHIKYDHDYKEKQETAFSLGLTESINEKRSIQWFVDELFKISQIVSTAGVALS